MDEPSQPLLKDTVKPLDVVGQVYLIPNCLMLFGWDDGMVRTPKVRKTDTFWENAGNSLSKTTAVRNASVATRGVAT